MSRPRPKRQHFLPEMHLRKFVGSRPAGQIWTYDKEKDHWRSSTPRNTAVEANLHSVLTKEGTYIDALEEHFSRIETDAADGYEQLLRGEIPTGQRRIDFAHFLGTVVVRSPSKRRLAGEVIGCHFHSFAQQIAPSKERFEQLLSDFEKAKGPIDSNVRSGLRDFALDPSRYKIQVSKQATIGSMGAADDLGEVFFDMAWGVIEPRAGYFITGDSAVTRRSPRSAWHPTLGDLGFENPAVRVSFPLSPNRCLIMEWQDSDLVGGVMPTSGRSVLAYNSQRAYYSDRYLYSDQRDEYIRNLGQQYKGRNVKFVPPGTKPEDWPEIEVRRRRL